ncbi:zinc dependent phospholipase C family protein [Planctomycetota bacterium]
MPGTITHLWIFKETMFKDNMDFLNDFSSEPKKETNNHKFVREFLNNIETSHTNLLKTMGNVNWDQKTLTKKIKGWKDKDETGVLASYGYLGSNGPDLMSLPKNLWTATPAHEDLAALAHYNKTGALVIRNLAQLKLDINAGKWKENKGLRRTLECKLSYWLGHICHLAADIVAHPFVNSRAGALQLLQKNFRNFRGDLVTKLWKTHNIVEQLQDAYVKSYLFKKPGWENWKQVDFPVTASIDLRQNKKERAFIGRAFAKFYGQKDKGAKNYEYGIVGSFFISDKMISVISFRYYCNVITPDKDTMDKLNENVPGKAIGIEAFKNHIATAAELSRDMSTEALKYLVSEQSLPKNKVTDEDVFAAKKSEFKYLQKNWNIDTGHGFVFEEVPSITKKRNTDPYRKLVRLHVCTYPHGKYLEPKDPCDAPKPKSVSKGRKKKNTINSTTPRWCVEVLPQALVRKDKEASLDLWTASTKVKEVAEAGGSTRKQVAGKKPWSPTVNRVTWWKEKWSGSAVNKHPKTESGSQIDSPLFAFGKQKKDKDAREGKGWNDLLNKMIILTPKRDGVWDVGGSSGKFNDKSVKEKLIKYPTEQVYLKFHVFDDKGKAVLQCDSKKPENVKLQPRIHNIIIELNKENGGFKIKKVSLDGDRMCLWNSNDVKKRLTSTSGKPVSEPKKEVQEQQAQKRSWCPKCKAERPFPPDQLCKSCGGFGTKTVPLSHK